MNDLNIKYLKNLFLILFTFLIIIILKLFFTELSKKMIRANFFNNFILSKETYKDDRILKCEILKKNINNDYDFFIFGTSAAGAINPIYAKQSLKKDSLNLTFNGAKISEIYLFLEWYIQNKDIKKFPREIFLELKLFSFNDMEFQKRFPSELTKKFFLKFKYQFTDLRPLFLIKQLISHQENEANKTKILYIENGATYLDLSKSKNRNFNKEIINNFHIYVDQNINFKQLEYFKKLISICNDNNIKINFFISPVHNSLRKAKNSYYLKSEYFLINNIFKHTDIENIFYFNSNTSMILNDKNYHDPIHYNYGIGNQIINSFYIKNNYHDFKIIDRLNYKNLNLYD